MIAAHNNTIGISVKYHGGTIQSHGITEKNLSKIIFTNIKKINGVL
jgi:hypothetical protein